MSRWIERKFGRVTVFAEVWRPTMHDVRLEVDLYTDGITAGLTLAFFWLSAGVWYSWQHENCPDCREDSQ